MLYFHGIEFTEAKPKKFSFFLPLNQVFFQVVSDFPRSYFAVEKRKKEFQQEITKILLASQQANVEEKNQNHQTLLKMSLFCDFLEFLKRNWEKKTGIEKLLALLSSQEKEASKEEEGLEFVWEQVKYLFLKEENFILPPGENSSADFSLEQAFQTANTFPYQLLQLVQLSFLDSTVERPAPNLKLVFVGKNFPDHQWVWAGSFGKEKNRIWESKNPFCQFSFLQKDLLKTLTASQSNFGTSARANFGTSERAEKSAGVENFLEPPPSVNFQPQKRKQQKEHAEEEILPAENLNLLMENVSAEKSALAGNQNLPFVPVALVENKILLGKKKENFQSKKNLFFNEEINGRGEEENWDQATLEIKFSGDAPRQLEFFSQRPFEVLDDFQRNILKKYGSTGLILLYAILRQFSKTPSFCRVILDLGELNHLLCPPDKNQKNFAQKTWPKIKNILEELEGLEVYRRLPSKNKTRKSKFLLPLAKISNADLIFQKEEYQEEMQLEFLLDPMVCADSPTNRFHMGAPFLLMENQFFHHPLPKEYSPVIFLYSYIASQWLYSFDFRKKISPQVEFYACYQELLHVMQPKISKSGKYRAIHKLLHFLRFMKEQNFIGDYQISADANKYLNKPSVNLKPTLAMLQFLNQAQFLKEPKAQTLRE